ncbi:hypothetical protein CCMA1212_007864 [Trichoderma ghanense]|uniref:Uncharacterized protein n=1 Tax=Trichoderma ghanense TaxID=65468 RepID=A0ABY2GY16_9HYPO
MELDKRGRPWTSDWGGEVGCAKPVAEDVLRVDRRVDMRHEPVFHALFHALFGSDHVKSGNAVLPHGDEAKMMAALAGTGSLCNSWGRCSWIKPSKMHGLEKDFPSAQEAVELIREAGTFFVSTTDGEAIDTNNRGDWFAIAVSGDRLHQSMGNLKTRTKLAVKVNVAYAKFVKSGLLFSGIPTEY